MTERDWGQSSGFPTGAWRVRIHPDGAMDVYVPGGRTVDFSTKVAVKGDTLTITGVPVCPGVRGRYSWHLTSGRLRMRATQDSECPPRAALFGGTWTAGS